MVPNHESYAATRVIGRRRSILLVPPELCKNSLRVVILRRGVKNRNVSENPTEFVLFSFVIASESNVFPQAKSSECKCQIEEPSIACHI